jgi:hypothetical protein
MSTVEDAAHAARRDAAALCRRGHGAANVRPCAIPDVSVNTPK